MLTNWLRAALDSLFPQKDDAKGAEALTSEMLTRLFHPVLAREAWITSFFPYREKEIRSLIRGVKFYGVTRPLPFVGNSRANILEIISDKKMMAGWDTPLVVPIPSSRERRRERGYNQAERFAEAIASTLGSAVLYDRAVLERKHRESQVGVPRASRAENIQGAFFVLDPELVHGKQIILIDDVVETGATMKDARRALAAAGASDVIGFAVAH